MKNKAYIFLLVTLCILTACTNQANEKLSVSQDFEGTLALLNWFKQGRPQNAIKQISSIAGIDLSSQNALMQQQLTAPSFAQELLRFCTIDPNDSLQLKDFAQIQKTGDVYGLTKAWTYRKAIAQLADSLIAHSLMDSAIALAASYMPKTYTPQGRFAAYFVATGWGHGDAYIRPVQRNGDTLSIAKDGEPTSFYNLALICQSYGTDTQSQMESLKGVMAHEAFHVLFANYKKQSEIYTAQDSGSYYQSLLSLVHNEGIAHYICYHDLMKTDFEVFESYEESSLMALEEAQRILVQDTTSVQTAQVLITKANTGSFWNKYGAIAGMFMAYRIEEKLGLDALVQTIELGDAAFIETYKKACAE